MLIRRLVQGSFAVTMMAVITTVVWACGDYGQTERPTTSDIVLRLAEISKQRNCYGRFSDEISELVRELRSYGQQGLDAMITHRNPLVADMGEQSDPVARFDEFIDQVAAQKFATQSKLFWHTSMDEALTESKVRGVPVINLRLLGRLDEDQSCANSRFFRTTLYPHDDIARRLREEFVLLWQPVRQVPKVTIDFGDGRQLRRPLTGNSVHLVLNSSGQPIDALPGLVSTNSFIQWLDQVSAFWKDSDRNEPNAFRSQLAEYHRQRAAQRRAESEMAIRVDQNVSQLNPLDPRWDELAAGQTPVRLAAATHELLGKRRPDAELAMPLAASKMPVELPMLRMVHNLESHIARDSAFNLFGLQPKIDDWFATAHQPPTVQDLTEQIYREVFLMPLDDPWLGLSPTDSFAALENDGRVMSK